MIVPTRRGFITGLVSFLAAPAIVRVASLMPVRALPEELELEIKYLPILTFNQITRSAMRLWKNSPEFIALIDTQYEHFFT